MIEQMRETIKEKTQPIEKAKFLLVDDLKENLLALEALIRREDAEIYQARSGTDALELLVKHDFAVALIDVQMPGMSGFELAELMRGIAKTKHIPIIFVTATAKDQNYVFKGYETGAVDFLYKPLDIHAVKSKVNVFFDLYQQKKVLKEKLQLLQQTQDELQKAVRTRDEFMSIASHELKSPLTTLKLQVQMKKRNLKKGDLSAFTPEKLAKMIDSDERQFEKLILLIDDMLDVSRINSGKLTMNPERFDLCDMVREIAERFSDQASAINCKIHLDLCQPTIGYWDRFRIEQVVTNLITNAMRYGVGKPIFIQVSVASGKICLIVRDEGRGIAEENQKRIFERFERVRGDDVKGLGLGLFIVSQILESHAGSISVKSKLGQGSSFIVELPLTLENG